MTEVSFYVLEAADPAARELFACRLAEKAFHLGHRVFLRTAGERETQALDALLWRFRPASFVPHAIAAEDPSAPVLLGHGEPGAAADVEVLINLGNGVPDCFSQFRRVSEIVVQQPAVQQATRAHFRFYREHGCPLHTHRIGG